jgi:hypothetical protein
MSSEASGEYVLVALEHCSDKNMKKNKLDELDY